LWGQLPASLIGQKLAGSQIHDHKNQIVSFYTVSQSNGNATRAGKSGASALAVSGAWWG
jgi:hypothetical protein